MEAATCLICHEGLDQGPVQHAPVAGGMCTTCHEFSGSGEEMKVALVGGAVSDNTAPLCTMCHDDVAAALETEHTHAPAASGDCVLCHNPHRSDHEHLLNSPQVELCTMCHGDVATALETAYAHAPAASGECTLCHNPHGSIQPRQLNGPEVELCATCHDDVAEQLALAHPHAPVKASCAVCHDPHGSTRATKLREDTNDVCLACHLVRPEPEVAPRTSLFGRDVGPDLVPLLNPERVIALDRTRRYGHPLMRHPVAGPKDPIDPTKPFTCLSCHVPHGSGSPALQRYAAESASEACTKCH